LPLSADAYAMQLCKQGPGIACTDTVCIPNPGLFASSIEHQFVSSFANRLEPAFRTVKKTYNK